MSNATTRRRGRHAAPTAPPPIVIRAPRPAPRRDGFRLPGMELLGFYDRPYQVAVDPAPVRRRPRAVLESTPRRIAATSPTERVASLWETTELNESALEWWKPQIVARRKLGGRRVRTSTTLLIVLGVVGLVFVVASSLRGSERAARESLETMGADARQLVEGLPALEEVLAGLSQPAPPDLTESTEQVLATESAARRLFTDAGSQEGARREVAVSAAGGVLDITSRLNRLLAYRLAAERLLVVPSLPTDPTANVPATTETVAAWRAETEIAVSELASEVLPDHRVRLEEWLASLDAWQADYLDALMGDDVEAARNAVGELESGIVSLREGLLDELAEEGGELRAELADARAEAERLVGG